MTADQCTTKTFVKDNMRIQIYILVIIYRFGAIAAVRRHNSWYFYIFNSQRNDRTCCVTINTGVAAGTLPAERCLLIFPTLINKTKNMHQRVIIARLPVPFCLKISYRPLTVVIVRRFMIHNMRSSESIVAVYSTTGTIRYMCYCMCIRTHVCVCICFKKRELFFFSADDSTSAGESPYT